jgi:hypothetical protein
MDVVTSFEAEVEVVVVFANGRGGGGKGKEDVAGLVPAIAREPVVILSDQLRDRPIRPSNRQPLIHLRRLLIPVHADRVCDETSDMWRRHARAGQGCGGITPTDTNTRDSRTTDPDINRRARVGILSFNILAVDGADSDHVIIAPTVCAEASPDLMRSKALVDLPHEARPPKSL